MILETAFGLMGGLAVTAGYVVLRRRRENRVTPELLEIPEHVIVLMRGKEHLRKIAKL